MKPVSFAAASKFPSLPSWMPTRQQRCGRWKGRPNETADADADTNGNRLFRPVVFCRRGQHTHTKDASLTGILDDVVVDYQGLTIPASVWGCKSKIDLRPHRNSETAKLANVKTTATSTTTTTAMNEVISPPMPSASITTTEYYEKDVVEQDEKGNLTLQLAQPLVPVDAWERQTGCEFEDPELVQKLARSGLYMATQEENEWVLWKPSKDTQKAISSSPSVESALNNGEVLVYLGKVKSNGGNGDQIYQGEDLPFVMTKSILPLSAEDMAELLMDSSRVKTYNKISLGRTDIKTLSPQTKIVRNLTQPPITSSKMVSVTLMHSRPLDGGDKDLLAKHTGLSQKSKDRETNGYLVVTRAVPGADTDSAYQSLTRNDIMLGVNLLQEVGPDSCLMTTVTHVYSPSLPRLLASKVGISSAIGFVKDIRHMCKEKMVGAE